IAYQGLGRGVAEDAYGPRLFCAHLPEVLVAVSCSKNFGLYRERTGALHVLSATPAAADAAISQLMRIARGLYSMPPDHGAAIVHGILTGERLRTSWEGELEAMRLRIQQLRAAAVQRLAVTCPSKDFGYIARQRGMFSYLGVDPQAVRELRERHHVYMMDDSRINVAGLRMDNIGYFAEAVGKTVR
ncbi:MAG: aminotransferase class I/II-fold pyridoxal phosphate-dependent enzyme, partial [Gammaproteobacteria bacterium]|nr:aminotransferase class I/II-fold pyridoxal phosphate-dependent enzyme [Gammaproteobacteria bacterium]